MLAVSQDDRRRGLFDVIRDEHAFRDWYDDALPRVYRYLFIRSGRDVALAEELTQQTFTEAIRRHAQFDGRSDSVTWLCAIGRNKLVDHHRRLDRDRRRHLRLVAGWADAEDTHWRSTDEREAVERALDAVGGEQRIALVLRYLDGLTTRELATALGRSESAADSLLSRAREAFRRAYRGNTDA